MSLLDPKPLGAFLEYSVRPIIQDSMELIQMCDEKGIKPTEIMSQAWKLFLVKMVFDLMTTLVVTGAICFTALKILNFRPIPS